MREPDRKIADVSSVPAPNEAAPNVGAPSVPAPNVAVSGDRLTVSFADDAHETFEDLLTGWARHGWYVRLDGTDVRLDDYRDGVVHFHPVDDHGEPVGDQHHQALRDSHGLLTVTTVEVQ